MLGWALGHCGEHLSIFFVLSVQSGPSLMYLTFFSIRFTLDESFAERIQHALDKSSVQTVSWASALSVFHLHDLKSLCWCCSWAITKYDAFPEIDQYARGKVIHTSQCLTMSNGLFEPKDFLTKYFGSLNLTKNHKKPGKKWGRYSK